MAPTISIYSQVASTAAPFFPFTIHLNDEEKKLLQASAQALKTLII